MTVSMPIPGANFTQKVGGLYPYAKNCLIYNLFGVDGNTSRINFLGDPATVNGAPSYGAAYATVGASDYFDSGVITEGEFSFAQICEIPTSTIYCGAYVAGGASLATAETLTRATTSLQFGVNGSARITIAGTYTGYRFIAGTYDGGGATVYLSDGSTLNRSGPGIYANANVGVDSFKVAGRTGSSSFNVAATMVYDRALTPSEMSDVFTFMKGVVEGRGLTVS